MLSIMRVAGLSSSACWGSTFKDRPKVVAVPEVLGTWDRRYLLLQSFVFSAGGSTAAHQPAPQHPGREFGACMRLTADVYTARPPAGRGLRVYSPCELR